MLEGRGAYYYPDGHRFEGTFANNERQGTGTTYYKDGVEETGEYRNHLPVGVFAYKFPDGEVRYKDFTKY